MKIVLALPTLLAKNDEVIFAPRILFTKLVDGLVARGHEVAVFAPENVKTKGLHIGLGSQVEKAPLPSIKDRNKPEDIASELTNAKNMIDYELFVTCKAFDYAKENKFDLVHIYLGYQSHYPASLATTASVFTLHDPVFAEGTLENNLLKVAATQNYLAISNNQTKTYSEALGIECAKVIYHGIDSEKFKFNDDPKNDLIFLGRFVPEKGADDALTAAQEAGKKIQIVSSDNYKKIAYYQKVIEPLINENVQVLPFLKEDELPEFYGQAKAMLFPIKWAEPFGMVMIEAMSCGTPVIAYGEGSVPEIIKDGETGFIINRNNDGPERIIKETGIAGLAQAIKKIYQMNDDEYKAMRQQCRQRVLDKFSFDQMVEGHLAAYEDLTK